MSNGPEKLFSLLEDEHTSSHRPNCQRLVLFQSIRTSAEHFTNMYYYYYDYYYYEPIRSLPISKWLHNQVADKMTLNAIGSAYSQSEQQTGDPAAAILVVFKNVSNFSVRLDSHRIRLAPY